MCGSSGFYPTKPHPQKQGCRDFPVVQWLSLHVPNAGGPGSIPGQGTRSLPYKRGCSGIWPPGHHLFNQTATVQRKKLRPRGMGATSKVIQGRCISAVLNLCNLISRAPNSKIPFLTHKSGHPHQTLHVISWGFTPFTPSGDQKLMLLGPTVRATSEKPLV